MDARPAEVDAVPQGRAELERRADVDRQLDHRPPEHDRSGDKACIDECACDGSAPRFSIAKHGGARPVPAAQRLVVPLTKAYRMMLFGAVSG